MKKFFDPKTVALIGASGKPFRPGNQLFQNLKITFGDDFHPINPRADEIDGKKVYKSILDVPAEIDLAIVFIPASGAPPALEQCAEKGVKRVIIESGGFAETGALGAALQDRCLSIAREAGMRLWGPNCMGMINVTKQKVCSFLMPMMWQGRFVPGKVAMAVQSGMLSAGFLATILYKDPFGLSKVASIGNKMDVDEVDILEYLVDDPDTGVIAMYLESMARGREFFELAKSTDKPVVVLKSGRTDFGVKAANSHTAALAQDDAVLDSALRQSGVIRVRGMGELMDVARCLSLRDFKPVPRARVAVLSFSGGAGVVASDEIHDAGMELAELSDETLSRIKSVFPDWMDPANPVDLYPGIEKNGPVKAVGESLDAVMDDPGVDAVYVHMFAPPVKTKLLDYDSIAERVGRYDKPMVAWIMGAGPGADDVKQKLQEAGVPVVKDIDKGVRILSAITLRR